MAAYFRKWANTEIKPFVILPSELEMLYGYPEPARRISKEALAELKRQIMGDDATDSECSEDVPSGNYAFHESEFMISCVEGHESVEVAQHGLV